MKLKVEQVFQDKYNKTIYKAGEVITVEKARGDELLADDRKLVSLVADEAPKKRASKK